jgi:SAM-dependent methyltransferase
MAIDHSQTYQKFRLRNIPHMQRLRQIRRTVKSLGVVDVDRYLDVGSSNGFVTSQVQSIVHARKVWGIDYSREHLESARSRYPEFRFEEADLNGSFDLGERFSFIICFETIEHTGRIANALTEIYKHLLPGGILLLTVPIETGWIGITKFALKNFVYRDSFDEIKVSKWQYLRSLVRGDRMSQLRDLTRPGYGEHYGFDYRDINDHFDKYQIPYTCSREFTTYVYVVRKASGSSEASTGARSYVSAGSTPK